MSLVKNQDTVFKADFVAISDFFIDQIVVWHEDHVR